MVQDIQKLRKTVEEMLTPTRFHHSLCVQKRAMLLAKSHGADWFKAGVAGLLHDICQCMPKDRQLNYLRSCGILLDVFTLENPPLWHAICGEQYIRRKLNITDPGILSAVRYHTTGRAAMSTLEQVVYLADMTSDDRDFPGVEEMRQLADRDLDAAMKQALCHTVEEQAQRKKPLVQDGYEAYNFYVCTNEEAYDATL